MILGKELMEQIWCKCLVFIDKLNAKYLPHLMPHNVFEVYVKHFASSNQL